MRPEVYFAYGLVALVVVDMIVLSRLARRLRRECWIDTLSRWVEEQIVVKHLLPRLWQVPTR